MCSRTVVMSGLAALVSFSSFAAHTGRLSMAAVPGTERTFRVSFADHARETNGLWVVYGTADRGVTTNGWDRAKFLTTVRPETDSFEYEMPADWDAATMPFRFLLSEVPYDYDYTITFLRSGGEVQASDNALERIALTDFDFKLSYRMHLGLNIIALNNDSPAILRSSDGGAGGTAPTFGLLPLSRKNWRFDYNDKTGVPVAGVQTGVDYDIDLSYRGGLVVNGNPIATLNPEATYSTASSKGKMVLFQGSQGQTSANNNGIFMKMYGVRIFDENDVLLVNLVPMVKGGEPGFYDTVRDKFYFGDMTFSGTRRKFHLTFSDGKNPVRVESANPFFASSLAVDPTSHDEAGKIIDGQAVKFTGHNDWHGELRVANHGAVVAAFGRGLGASDHLVLGPNLGSYGGFGGQANAPFGGVLPANPAAGTLYTRTADDYLAFTAADGDLTVNVGGAESPQAVTFNSSVRRLSLNNGGTAGDIEFRNPVQLLAGSTPNIFRMKYGTATMTGNVTGQATGGGAMLRCYGENIGADAILWMNGAQNEFYRLQVYDGRYGFGGGSSTRIGGNLSVFAGELVVSNATLALLLAAGERGGVFLNRAEGDASRLGGKLSVRAGGQLEAYGLEIGANSDYAGTATAEISGKVTLKINPNGPDYTSLYVYRSAGSVALTLNDGADVTVPNNFVFHRQNVRHNGGTLTLNGGAGVTQMGGYGTACYTLSGGALVTPGVDANVGDDCIARFIFDGGKLETSSQALSNYFVNFNPTNGSCVAITGAGGEFSSTVKDVAIATALSSGGDWTAEPADYLTAPAFRKTGAKALTLRGGEASYSCATEVAEGVLRLTTGDNGASLPSNNVVRLTGGTLDLGGVDQTLRALLGTAGAVRNGSVTVTEGVYPGGAGTVGSFTCDAALSGALNIDLAEDGSADALVTTQALDLSGLDLVLNPAEGALQSFRRAKILQGPYTGTFKSVSGLPSGWRISYGQTGVSVGCGGLTAIVR